MKIKNYYYHDKSPFCKDMELNKKGYPVYKDSKKLVHRYMAKKYLLNNERRLKEWEEVHHVDGDKLNYNPNNLVILSKEDHRKISRRLNLEMNLNKANSLLILLVLFLFVYHNQNTGELINKIIGLLLALAIFIPFYPKITSWIVKKTKLYKVIDYKD